MRLQIRDDVFLFLSEADFMVPHRMHSKLTSGQQLRMLQSMRAAWTEQQERQAMIIPAFERLKDVPAAPDAPGVCAPDTAATKPSSTCFLYGDYDVPVTKASLHAMVEDGRASFFYKHTVRSALVGRARVQGDEQSSCSSAVTRMRPWRAVRGRTRVLLP